MEVDGTSLGELKDTHTKKTHLKNQTALFLCRDHDLVTPGNPQLVGSSVPQVTEMIIGVDGGSNICNFKSISDDNKPLRAINPVL